MGNIYTSGEYLEKNPTWDVEDSPWKAEQVLKILKENNVAPKNILEIGCGAGEILNHMSKSYKAKYHGYEVSPQAIEICNKIGNPDIAFTLGDALEDSSLNFDVTLAIDVFEHVDDYLGFIKKISNTSKYTVFHIPLDLSIFSILKNNIMRQRENVGHLHYFNKDTALASLEYAGHTIVDYKYTGKDFPFETTSRKVGNRLRMTASKIHSDWAVKILGGRSLLVLTK